MLKSYLAQVLVLHNLCSQQDTTQLSLRSPDRLVQVIFPPTLLSVASFISCPELIGGALASKRYMMLKMFLHVFAIKSPNSHSNKPLQLNVFLRRVGNFRELIPDS